MVNRIEGLHLHLEARAHLVAAMLLPKALYAASVAPPGIRELSNLRAKSARAVWGQGNRWRSVEAMFSLLTKSHITDPVQKFSHDAFICMRRVLRRRRDFIPMFERVLRYRQEHPRMKTGLGPVAALLSAAKFANLDFHDEDVCRLHFLNENDTSILMETEWLSPENNSGEFAHIVREALRIEQWSMLEDRRPCFHGAQHGVDREASLELHKMLSGLERCKLRTILCGAVHTRSRSARILGHDGLCKCCNQQALETPTYLKYAQLTKHHATLT